MVCQAHLKFSLSEYPLVISFRWLFASVVCLPWYPESCTRKVLDTPCARGLLTPVRTGYCVTLWVPRAHGADLARAHGVQRAEIPTGQEHYIYALLPPPTSNPNVLLSSTIATPHFAQYSQSLHPNLLKLWGLGEQDPIYNLTKPNRVPRNISSPLTCYSWSLGS